MTEMPKTMSGRVVGQQQVKLKLINLTGSG